jgi:hypothetical protein
MALSFHTHKVRRRLAIAGLAAAILAAGTAVVYNIASATTPASTATMFVPAAPVRILDTRTGIGTGGATLPLTAGGVMVLQVTGVQGIPADAVAVEINVTVTDGTIPAFLTVWPTGTDRPVASSLNITPGQNTPNMITAQLGASGQLSFFTNGGAVNVIADLAGYFVKANTVTGVVTQVPAEARWSVLWPLTAPAGAVGYMTVREDGSIRTQSLVGDTLTKVAKGQYCIKATGALEGAVGSIQVAGGAFTTIQVSEGVGSFCNTVAGANITVQILQLAS